MDNVILSHFYASAAFLTTKCSYVFYQGNSIVSLHGTSYGILAYMATMGWLCYQDPKLRTSLNLVLQIMLNKVRDKWKGPAKNRDKAVRTLRRPKKKKGFTAGELQQKFQQMQPVTPLEEDL